MMRRFTPLMRYLTVVFLLELAGAGALFLGYFTLRQTQANYEQQTAETQAIYRQSVEIDRQVSAIITYFNTSNAASRSGSQTFVALLGAQCVLLLDVADKTGVHVPILIRSACAAFTLPPPVVIPVPSPAPTTPP